MSGDASPLAALTSAELESGPERVVVVPVGATEQHGPHLPLETDTLLATAVAEAIVTRTPGTLLAPALELGCSSHHSAFAGTISLSTQTFVGIVVDVCRSLARAGLTAVLLNAHGGNRAQLDVALTELAGDGVRAYAFTYWQLLEDVVVDELGKKRPPAPAGTPARSRPRSCSTFTPTSCVTRRSRPAERPRPGPIRTCSREMPSGWCARSTRSARTA